MEEIDEQDSKALSPIDATLLPIITDAKLLQEEKADSPIDVTLSPIVNADKELH